MDIIDISWPISPEITQYKNRSLVGIFQTKTHAYDGCQESLLLLSSHAGTHVDTPRHFIKEGTTSYSLSQLIGKAFVKDATKCREKISAADLTSLSLEEGTILLFKTSNSFLGNADSFTSSFVYLDESAAWWCVKNKVKAVGIDYLGIERSQEGHKTHYALLGHSIPIVEGLRLSEVEEGEYTFICLPLSINEIDGLPARAVLLKNKL